MTNKVNTYEEYMNEGFTLEECPLIQAHDKIFNQMERGAWGKEKQWDKYDILDNTKAINKTIRKQARKMAFMMVIIEKLGL